MGKNKSNKISSQEKPILSDHKKVGKKYIPPFLELAGNLQEISYTKKILPEILWICLACESLGFKRGVEVCEAIATTVHQVCSHENSTHFGFVSSFSLLTPNEINEIKKKPEITEELIDLCISIEPLTFLYKGHPLSVFCSDKREFDKDSLLARLKRVVSTSLDKCNILASVAQATVVDLLSKAGRLKVTESLNFPNINVIVEHPMSPAAERAESFVRMTTMMEYNFQISNSINTNWAERFWNQGIYLDDCES